MNDSTSAPDLILHHGLVTTLDPATPTVGAVAITDGKFRAIGRDDEVMAPTRPRRRRPLPGSWQGASGFRPAPTRPGLRPTTRGSHLPGSSPAGRSAACGSIRSTTASIARRCCACGPRTSPDFPTRRARKGASRSASSPISSYPIAIISPVPRRRSPTRHRISPCLAAGSSMAPAISPVSMKRRRLRRCRTGRRCGVSAAMRDGATRARRTRRPCSGGWRPRGRGDPQA